MRKILALIPLTALLAACVFPPTPVTPTPTPTPAGPCQAATSDSVIAYQRPSLAAEVFATLESGFEVEILVQTADGWLGFDPGVAQAGNIGVFRYRWIQQSPAITVQGDCGSLPVVVGPQVGVCYTMPMASLDVYVDANTSSPILATLDVGDYAAVLGVTAADWARVDLSQGVPGQALQGWIPASALNMNGPCEDLPVLTPEP